jgi:hypothetical protein
MKYIKTFESFKLNETLDMMTFPVDPIPATLDVYADAFDSAKQTIVEFADDLVGGVKNFEKSISSLIDFLFEKIGLEKAVKALSDLFGFKNNESFFADDAEGRQTTNWKTPNAFVEFLKSIDFKDVLRKMKEKAKEFGGKFKEYSAVPNMSTHDGSVSYKGFLQGFLSFIQSVLYVGSFANFLTAGIGGKLIADLFDVTLNIWSSLGYLFLAPLAAILVFMLIRKTIYALSSGKIA